MYVGYKPMPMVLSLTQQHSLCMRQSLAVHKNIFFLIPYPRKKPLILDHMVHLHVIPAVGWGVHVVIQDNTS